MSQGNPAPNQSVATGGAPAKQPELDLEQLADKVYRLMMQDLRLSSHRGDSLGTRRRKK